MFFPFQLAAEGLVFGLGLGLEGFRVSGLPSSLPTLPQQTTFWERNKAHMHCLSTRNPSGGCFVRVPCKPKTPVMLILGRGLRTPSSPEFTTAQAWFL